jgi:hypothetical protein
MPIHSYLSYTHIYKYIHKYNIPGAVPDPPGQNLKVHASVLMASRGTGTSTGSSNSIG